MLDKFYANYEGVNPRELSPLALAFVGDGVFELLIRTYVISKGNNSANSLHKMCREFVKAKSQAAMYFKVAHMLTEQELAVFKRGRNAKSHTVPKNADLLDYKHATGFEALIGFLYLDGKIDRIMEIFSCCV